MPYEPPFQTNAEIDALCMEIAELVGAFTAASGLSTSPRLHRKLRIRTIRSSLMIEGNTLSEEAVTAIIDGKRVLGPKRDIIEVKNAQRAYDLMESLDPANIDDLLRTHGVMMDKLVETPGVFRSKNAGVFDGEVLIHAGTPARYVAKVVGDLFKWLKSTKLHPLVASCVFHYEFEFIHPFADGNGRVGRLWHTLILSRWRAPLAWLPVESIILDRQQGYYAAFVKSEAQGSCEYFVAFMLRAIRDALLLYMSGGDEIGLRQERALAYFAENPKARVDDLASYLGCSKRSAERTVALLKASGKLVRQGSSRAGTWEVVGEKGTE